MEDSERNKRNALAAIKKKYVGKDVREMSKICAFLSQSIKTTHCRVYTNNKKTFSKIDRLYKSGTKKICLRQNPTTSGTKFSCKN